MIIKRKFEYGLDPEYGNYGIRPLNMPNFNYFSEGMGIAHDLLEHFDESGSLIDEIMSMGSMIHIRINGYYWNGFKTYYGKDPIDNLTSELITNYINYKNDIFEDNYICNDEINPDIDEIIKQIIKDGKKLLLSEFSDYFTNYEDNYYNPIEEKKILNKFLYLEYNYIKKGYIEAQKKYNGFTSEYLCYMFYEVEKKINEVFKENYYFENEGDQLEIIVDLVNEDVKFNYIPIYELENDYYYEEEEEEEVELIENE